MSIKLLTTGALNKRINMVVSSFARSGKLLHEVMCECLMRAYEHGDVTTCQRLYTQLEGTPAWREGIKAWFAYMGPITARGDTWKMKEGWSVNKDEKFKLAEAETTDVTAKFGEPPAPRIFSLAVWYGQLQGIFKRIDKAVEEDRFQGDPEAFKALAKNVLEFVQPKMNELGAVKTGELEKQADNILKSEAPASTLINAEEAAKRGIKVTQRKPRRARQPEQTEAQTAAA